MPFSKHTNLLKLVSFHAKWKSKLYELQIVVITEPVDGDPSR